MPNADTSGCEDQPVSPNQPKTPQRAFRAPDELWKPALAKARRNGETLTDVLIRALAAYIEEDDSE